MTGRVAVVIPAYDAAATLARVVEGLRTSLPHATVIVVDDGSTDGTGNIARGGAHAVVRHDGNRGKGAALRTGFAAALDLGATTILTCDADGQHDPQRAPALLEALARADLVIGARQRAGTAMPPHRRLTNSLASAAISRCAGCHLTDPQSGYRAIRAAVLRAVHPQGDRYEYETEMLIDAARAGFIVTEVPIPTIYGAASHFRLWSDAARVIGAIWRHRARPTGAGAAGPVAIQPGR